ncbi:MAG: TIR domain-containing protein [Chloroflexi bacterium]|nr:MAG: TIR domain-containing protein [Chloroflexota bacterium]
MTKLFISYAHADTEAVIRIVEDLREAGHDVWIDTRGIQGGTLWGAEIAKAIVDHDVFLLFVSSKSIVSDFVRREVDIAFEEKKRILPVMLEKVEIPVHLDYQLAGIQYIDYCAPDWKSRLLAALSGRQALALPKKRKKLYPPIPALEKIEHSLVLSNRARELQKSLQHLENYRLLLITGMPGIGKSTFARALLDFKPANSPQPFWYNFERQRSSGNSLGILLDHISDYLEVCLDMDVRRDVMAFRDTPGGIPSVSDIDVLISFLNQDVPIWLVFDNLETVLSRDTCGFFDDGLELLFESLKNSTHSARIVITNPFVPVLKTGEAFLEAGTQALALEGLDDASAVALLRAYGLEGLPAEKLGPLIHEVNGHPFVLNHIAHYIQTLGVSAALEDLQGGLEEINARFGDSLKQRLSSQEFNALQCLTILNRETMLTGLCQIAQVRSNVIVRLREKGLLQANEAGKFWLHNIVRNSLRPAEPGVLRPAHLRAMNFYRRQELPLSRCSIDDYASVLEWHHHAVEANDVISAYSALYSTGLKDQLMKWNEYDLLVRLCEQTLSAVYRIDADLQEVTANLSSNERINIYHVLGAASFLLGDFATSIEHLKAALHLLQFQEDRELKIKLLIDLAESCSGAGDFRSAMELCDQLATLLIDVKNGVLQAKFLHLRGIVHRDRGELEAAKRDLEGALNLYRNLDDPTHLGSATIDLGNVYYYEHRFADATANYQRALAAFESQGDTRGEFLARFNIADIFLQNEQFQMALEQIRPAVDIAHKRKLTNLELKASLILAEAQIAVSCLSEAEQSLTRIKTLVKKHGSARDLGQECLLLGFMHSKRNQPEQAMNCFRRAFELLENRDCQYECARGYLLFAAFLKEQGKLQRAQEALTKAWNLFTRTNSQLSLQTTERMLADILRH